MADRKDRNGYAGNRAESMPLSELKPHPRNYRSHPEDQIEHVVASLRDVGVYRNVVAARDGTLLAGHGVVEAARRAGMTEISVVRLDLDPDDPRALRVLAGDNYVSHLAHDDERALTEMLKELRDSVGLEGTGFDDRMLAALAMVTRTEAEIEDFDAAAEWVGMPEADSGTRSVVLVVEFLTEADREEFVRIKEVRTTRRGRVWGAKYPDSFADQEDVTSVRWEAVGGD